MSRFIAVASLCVLALVSQVSGQAPTQTFTINPAEVSLPTRAAWCQGETNTCVDLCDNSPTQNTCDPNTLAFTCTCQNGSAPGLQYYMQSMPYFICQQAFQDCIAANTNSAQAQANCTSNIKDQCGTLDPASLSSAGASSSPTATASSSSAGHAGTSGSTASNTASAHSTSTSKAAAAAPTDAHAVMGGSAALAAVGMLAYLL